MGLRRIIVAALLLALGATAACALLGVLVQDMWAWRLTSSAFVCVVVAGVWAIVARRDPDIYSVPQMVIMGGTAAAGLCFLAEIWGFIYGDKGLATGWTLIGAMVASTVPLRGLANPSSRVGAVATLVPQALAFVLLLMFAWDLEVWDGQEAAVVALTVGSFVLGMNLVGRSSDPPMQLVKPVWMWRLAGALLTLAAIGVGTVMLTIEFTSWTGAPNPYATVTALLSTFAVVMATGNLLRMTKGPPWARWVHLVSMASLLLEGVLVSSMVSSSYPGELEVRGCISLLIVIITSLLTTVVLDRRARIVRPTNVLDLESVHMECPACRTKQLVKVGGDACLACGLGISIVITQNKCFQCGYALAGITGATACPECGCPLTTAAPRPAL